MAGYSARQSSFTTGDTIEAADSNDEFNQILAAFHVSTGHTHDGTTAGDGGPLSTLYSNAISVGTGADTDIVLTFNANTSDGVITWMEDEDYFKFSDDILVNSTEKLQFRDTAIYLYSSADGQLDLVADTEIQIAATTIDINGNVDISGSLTLGGTAITSTAAELNIMDGDTSATGTTVADADRVVYNDAGTMKQVAVTDLDTYISATSKTLTNKTLTSPVLNTGVSGTAVLDEDNMSSDSATKLATQQSIKAYVDAAVTAEDLDVSSDSGTIAIDLDSETLTIAGGTGLDSSATSNTVTLAIDSTVATLTGSQTLTNKTLTSPVLNTGVSGTAVLDEDNLASDSATKLATQQSIKAYVDAVSTGITTFVMEDDDGTEVTISNNKEIKYIGSGLTTNWTDTDNGTDGDPYDLTFTVDAAQTGITSILATDLKIGEDDETKIDFETANEIHFYANNTEQVYLADNIFGPQSDSDVDLGTTGVRWKDAYVDSVTVTDDVTIGGDLTVNGTTTTVNSTTVTIDDPIFTLGGDSAPGSDDNKDRGIEFRWHSGTAAKVGFFGYDDSAEVFTFIPDASNSSEVFSGTVGNVAFGNIAGTLTTAAQTNITSTGALDGGSITSGFGAIDNGTSGIRTNTFTAETSILPDAVGGADLGSTSAEWGDIYIADDKKIYFGDGQDVSMEYDEDGTDTLLVSGHVTLADDKKLYFGTDKNLSIEYDEDGNDTTAIVAAGGLSMAPHGSSAGNGTELRFQELAANGAHYVGFKAPDSISSNEVWVLPNADGSADQVLKTDGSNALSWVDQAGGGTINKVADGAIAIRKPVILTAAGKAQQVAETTSLADSVSTNFAQALTNTTGETVSSVYDSNSETFSMAFKDTANSDYGTVVCGTPSNGTVTWGTPVVFESSAIDDQPHICAGGNRIHVTYYDTSNNNAGIRSASISGTTPTFAAETVFATGSTYNDSKGMHIAYDTSTNYVIVLYQGGTGTVKTWVQPIYHDTSDGTYTSGTATELYTGTLTNAASGIVFDPDTNRTIIAYKDSSNSNYPTANVVQSTGSSGSPTVTVGADTLLNGSSAADDMDIVYDTTNNKAVIFFDDSGGSNIVKAVIGTVTGGGTNTIAVTSATTIWDPSGNPNYWAAGYDGDKNRIQYFYHDEDSGDDFTYKVITPGASSLSVADGGVLSANANKMGSGSASFGAGHGVLCATFDSGNSSRISYGMAYFASITSSNLDNGNYLGVSAAAISDTATGTIIIPGGISEGHSSLTIGSRYFTNGAGTIGLAGNARGFEFLGKAISATEIQLQDREFDFYAEADGAVTLGDPIEITGSKVKPIEGASISVGDAVVLEAGVAVSQLGSVYDTGSDRTVVAYLNASSYGTACVLNRSGNTVVAGTPVVFNSASTNHTQDGITYDPDTDRIVIAFAGASDHFDYVVGTVTAGTNAIAFGSVGTINSSYTHQYCKATYDTNVDRVLAVARQQDGGVSHSASAYVGTVTGGTTNTISWGSSTSPTSTESTRPHALEFLPNISRHLLNYSNYSTSKVEMRMATVTGGTTNSVSWTSAVIINGGSGGYDNPDRGALSYDPDRSDSSYAVVAYAWHGANDSAKTQAMRFYTNNALSTTGVSSVIEPGGAYAQNGFSMTYDTSTDTHFMIQSTNNGISAVNLQISGDANVTGSISAGEASSAFSTSTASNYGCTVAFDSDNEKVVSAFRDEAASNVATAKLVHTNEVPTTKTNFDGFAQFTASDGNLVAAKLDYGIDNNRSGLTAGSTYYLNSATELTTTSTSNQKVGVALTATDLQIIKT